MVIALRQTAESAVVTQVSEVGGTAAFRRYKNKSKKASQHGGDNLLRSYGGAFVCPAKQERRRRRTSKTTCGASKTPPA